MSNSGVLEEVFMGIADCNNRAYSISMQSTTANLCQGGAATPYTS